MTTVVELFLPLGEGEDDGEGELSAAAERALGWPRGSVAAVRIVRRSLDARKGRALGYRLRCEVRDQASTKEASQNVPGVPLWEPGAGGPARRAAEAPASRAISPGYLPRVAIVGTGPAGTWAALELSAAGVPVTMVERGKPVQPRRSDLARLTRGELSPDSNYCFGEGGAGTYSDGKLYTRSKDRAGIARVLADLVRFGAPADVEVDARPHVGSNRLPRVLSAVRAHLEASGVLYRFDSACVGLRRERGRLRALRLQGGDEIPADVVVLATGHSARSTYEWARAEGVAVARKAIAVGVRLEHPQRCIDRIQYGEAAGHPRLPPAFYELTASAGARAAYSFCMCPGGWIVPAATERDGVVVNGMSLSKRDSRFANAGFVVPISEGDFGPDAEGALAGIDFQRRIEQRAFQVGGGAFRAPAQRLSDFLAGRASGSLGASSYRPGLTPANLDEVLPDFVTSAIRAGLRQVIRRMPDFLDREAVLVAAETRTSAPVRLLRDPASLQSPSVGGLYPVGEGAGYAGGIVSAALDGIRAARQIVLAAGGTPA